MKGDNELATRIETIAHEGSATIAKYLSGVRE
jgi:hypothetical protein